MEKKKIVIHLSDRKNEVLDVYEKACKILENYDPSHPEETTARLIDLEFLYVDDDNIRDARIVEEIICKYTYARMSKKEKFKDAISKVDVLGLIKDIVEDMVIKVRRERNYQYHFHYHAPIEETKVEEENMKSEDGEYAAKKDAGKRII